MKTVWTYTNWFGMSDSERLDSYERGKVRGLESKGMTAGMDDAKVYEGLCC